MKLSEAREKYNHGHFGNEPCEVGYYVWVKETDSEGTHEYIVKITEDDTQGVE